MKKLVMHSSVEEIIGRDVRVRVDKNTGPSALKQGESVRSDKLKLLKEGLL